MDITALITPIAIFAINTLLTIKRDNWPKNHDRADDVPDVIASLLFMLLFGPLYTAYILIADWKEITSN